VVSLCNGLTNKLNFSLQN